LEIAGGTGGRRGRLEMGGGQAKTEVGEGIVIFFYGSSIIEEGFWSTPDYTSCFLPLLDVRHMYLLGPIYSGPYIRLRDKGCERTTMN
jgi:hypothetical protein